LLPFAPIPRTGRVGRHQDRVNPGLWHPALPAEPVYMGQAQRIHTYDDELHERRRRLAVVRPIVDFEEERLKRLREKARDTRDP
jgi:hypothetical protein